MIEDPDFEFLDLRPRSWADAFPWIPGKAADQDWEQDEWWDGPIDDTDLATRNIGRRKHRLARRSTDWGSGQSVTSSRASRATFSWPSWTCLSAPRMSSTGHRSTRVPTSLNFRWRLCSSSATPALGP